jgi:hypothetical protein
MEISLTENLEEARKHDAAGIIVLLTALLGGAIVGGLLWVSWRFYYIPFLSPFIAAAGAAAIMRRAIDFTRINNLVLVTICAGIMGFALYGTFWVGKYFYGMSQYREVLRAEIEAENLGLEIDDEIANQLIHRFFEEETGQDGFIGFVMLEAKDGMTIVPTRSSYGTRQEANIGTPLTVLYWILEIIIIVRGIALMGRAATKAYVISPIESA